MMFGLWSLVRGHGRGPCLLSHHSSPLLNSDKSSVINRRNPAKVWQGFLFAWYVKYLRMLFLLSRMNFNGLDHLDFENDLLGSVNVLLNTDPANACAFSLHNESVSCLVFFLNFVSFLLLEHNSNNKRFYYSSAIWTSRSCPACCGSWPPPSRGDPRPGDSSWARRTHSRYLILNMVWSVSQLIIDHKKDRHQHFRPL